MAYDISNTLGEEPGIPTPIRVHAAWRSRPDLLIGRLADTDLLASALPGRCRVRPGSPPRIEMELPGRPGLTAEVETTQEPTRVVHNLVASSLPSSLVVTFDIETRADAGDQPPVGADGRPPVGLAVAWPRPLDVAGRTQRQWERQVARQVEHLLSREPLPVGSGPAPASAPRDHDDGDHAPGQVPSRLHGLRRRLADPGSIGLVGAIVAVGVVILLRRRRRRATTAEATPT